MLDCINPPVLQLLGSHAPFPLLPLLQIGCFGLSYCAHVQVALACMNPPGLACLFLESGGFWDAYSDGVRQGGAFTMKQVTWAFRNAKVRGVATGVGGSRAACWAGLCPVAVIVLGKGRRALLN